MSSTYLCEPHIVAYADIQYLTVRHHLKGCLSLASTVQPYADGMIVRCAGKLVSSFWAAKPYVGHPIEFPKPRPTLVLPTLFHSHLQTSGDQMHTNRHSITASTFRPKPLTSMEPSA